MVEVDPTVPLGLVEPSFSTFSKHLFKLKLWRTEFFQPAGAVRKYGKCSLEKKIITLKMFRYRFKEQESLPHKTIDFRYWQATSSAVFER